ncbi:protein ANTI-SILENCING 1-like isoform X1 [Iris pallida]|uniref:Protein ANTI-SILENCING 1-like isoform X1 n=1 Tax=Iris pallida TaxID=29817 RepID=A0AAX6IJ65_IRIPA|nr:protein ANTI-SILENCING 1-like isoform X1 [Iris pallida]
MEPDFSELQFQWGKKRGIGGAKKDSQFYESFMFDGDEYSLYDCAYLCKKDEDEPYIGKIIKIWEQDNKKKVKILWFFRPSDVLSYLGDHEPMEKEIFLASGEGVGLSNINPLESIAGKCSVVCTSKDKKNPQPSKEAVESADFFFYRTFDVGTCTISDKITDTIAGVEVKFLLNREEHNPTPVSKTEENGLDGNGKIDSGKYEAHADAQDDKRFKKMRLSSHSVKSSDDLENNKNAIGMRKLQTKSDKDDAGKGSIKETSGKMKLNEKNTKSLDESVLKSSAVSVKENGKSEQKVLEVTLRPATVNEKITKSLDEPQLKSFAVSVKKNEKPEHQVLEVTRRPDTDRSKWFKGLPWDGRMKKANEQGTLIFLDNFDRSFTATDLEDIIYRLFDQSCTVKIIPQLPVLSPHYGQAYVIFKTPDAADEVVCKINRGCLMQPNGRPFLASKGILTVAPKVSTIYGHLSLERRNQMQREEMRKAISTSHCSQGNTIEYEMALEWTLLQEKYNDCYFWLHKRQGGEVKQIKNSIKAKT